MSNTTINDVLEDIENLNSEDKEYVLDILSKRIAEEKRNALIDSVKQADIDYQNNNIKKGTVKELLKDLND
ncbi:MAG: hypothetical protein OEZ22_04300 [Spirochaetia bacterium]|nr:hypothetical protein [Spirochaetia bacterium]